MWDESIPCRGVNKVVSCVLTWSEICRISGNINELTICSNNCPSQCYFFLFGKKTNLEVINNKFLAKGYTHMEVDYDHSLIERGGKKFLVEIN